MSYLHENPRLFDDLISGAREFYKIDRSIIIHDYYVWIILKNIAKREPNIIFKGGTSLSKCYEVINRYSEDIDLNRIQNEAMTNTKYKKYHHNIFNSIKELGFSIDNEKYLRSGCKINRMYISIKDNEEEFNRVKVETYLSIKSYPTQKETVKSYFYNYLKEIGRDDIIKEYDLEPFEITVQSINRTFIDKIFAICDYYEKGTTKRQSRHIYDLYKLFDKINFDLEFFELFNKVREDRKNGDKKRCVSAQDGYDLISTLEKIVEKDFYRDDFNGTTSYLLLEEVKYEDCKDNLMRIINKLRNNV